VADASQAESVSAGTVPTRPALTSAPPSTVPSSAAPTTVTSIHPLATTSREEGTSSVMSPYLAGA